MKLPVKQTIIFLILTAAALFLTFVLAIAKLLKEARQSSVSGPDPNSLIYFDDKVLSQSTEATASVSFRIPAIFEENVTINKDLTVSGGKVTASNLIYAILPGNGIEIAGGQNPTISNTGVLSLQNRSGALVLEAGEGISIEGLKISASNNDKGSSQNIFKNIKVGQKFISASSNNDTFAFTPGEGIDLSLDPTGKIITISNTGVGGIYYAGNGLSLSGDTFFLNSPACSGTDKLSWTGSVFVCSSDLDTDTNNYLTSVSVAGTSVKTLTFSRNDLPDLSVEFADLDTDTTYTAGNGLSLSGTTFELGGALEQNLQFNGPGNIGIGATPAHKLDVAGIINAQNYYKNGQPFEPSPWISDLGNIYYQTGNVGIATSFPMEKLDINGNLRIFDENLQRGDLYTIPALNKTWTSSADFNAEGTTFSEGMQQPAEENELKVRFYAQNPLLSDWKYKKTINLNNGGGALSNYQIMLTINTQNLITAGKLQNNCADLRFSDADNSLLNYWIEADCNTAATKVWVKIPSLPAGNYSINLHYGNPSASSAQAPEQVFEFFDNFDSFNSAKWASTSTYSVSGGQITIPLGAVYSRTTIASQPGLIAEAKVKWTSVTNPCSFSIANTQSTQIGNAGASKLTYLTLTMGEVKAYGADGTTPSYNIVPGITQFAAAVNTSYILGQAITGTQFIYYKNRVQTNAYPGTWTAPFYIWLGYFRGADAGQTDISDIIADWILVRKYAAIEPTVTSFGEEAENYFAPGEQTWLSEILDAGENASLQPNKFIAQWELDGSDNIPPKFQLLGSNTGEFAGEETIYPSSDNYYQDNGPFDLDNNIEKEIHPEVTNSFRYWRVKVYLDTGLDQSDTPKVSGFRLQEYRPSITLSAVSQRVGIGTVSPTAKLEVADAQRTLALRTNTDYIAFLDPNGQTVGQVVSNGSGGVTYSTSGSDFAEYFKKADRGEKLEKGDLVCLDELGKATRCTSLNSQIIGVVSDAPGFAGNSSKQNDPDYVLVGLLGQLPVKVSSESGVINSDGWLSFAGKTIGKVLSECDLFCTAFVNPFTYAIAAAPVPQPQDDLQITGDLIVGGKTNLTDVSITGNITAGVLSLSGLSGSITSLGDSLKLQNESVIIDRNGNIQTAGEITARKINIAGDSVGEGTIRAGETQTTIKTGAVTKNSKIFITPTTPVNTPLAVVDKQENISFVIKIGATVNQDINFYWWVIN